MDIQSKPLSILYVAYHYPPILGSSGVHRTVAISRYLAEQNWNTTILTASIKAYDNWSKEQFSFIPNEVKVIRAFARNTANSFSFRGKYLSWMALPDNWQSWIIGGVLSGLKHIVKNKPNIIVSTYPIASAHIIAYILHKMTGIPWVADLRDPMAQEGYPSNIVKKKVFHWIEKKIVKHCAKVIVTTKGAKALYQKRFFDHSAQLWKVIPNGFDAKMFEGLEIPNRDINDKKIVLLHSGLIYPSERDPQCLFNAIAQLHEQGVITSENFELKLRATGHDHLFLPQLTQLGINKLVTLHPSIDFKDALKEMHAVDGLLLLQAENCNYQIPAKAYEYIKVQKPILALTPEEGDTGQLLVETRLATIAPLDDTSQIIKALNTFLEVVSEPNKPVLNESVLYSYSRQYQAKHFESLLMEVINDQPIHDRASI